MNPDEIFELKETDLGGRIGNLRTKTSEIETPALLPVIHPARQIIPCSEIRAMGYDAVITNAYTTFRQLEKSAKDGIHKIINYDGSIMTDSGGYQVLEYGSVDIKPEEMTRFEELLSSDIAVVLDKPTGLGVTKEYASYTVDETIRAGELTKQSVTRDDMIWSLPIQGGAYLDLVSKSAKLSAKLDYGCYALGSPVEVLVEYDYSLIVKMILAAKKNLPENRPFHLFGAGHPLIMPLAVALGCDLFDSASYMLYAKHDRYISPVGTVRVDDLRYLGCNCRICSKLNAKELRSLPKVERVAALARHNLALLKSGMEQVKQCISEGRLWEYVQSITRNHPRAFEAFRLAVQLSQQDKSVFESGTPIFKKKGLFCFEKIDTLRPELGRFRNRVNQLDLSQRRILVILPETKTKPFLKSEIFLESIKILSEKVGHFLFAFLCPNVGLVPAELSDIYPLSQYTTSFTEFPKDDPILHHHKWQRILALLTKKTSLEEEWILSELLRYYKKSNARRSLKQYEKGHSRRPTSSSILRISRNYRRFKGELKLSSLQV